MKKLMSLIACVTALAFITPVFAQDEEPPKKGKKVKKAPGEKGEKKPAKKAKKGKKEEE